MQKLTKDMNYLDIDKFMVKAVLDYSREEIEEHLMKSFDWTDRQVYCVTDNYYSTKKFKSIIKKRRRK